MNFLYYSRIECTGCGVQGHALAVKDRIISPGSRANFNFTEWIPWRVMTAIKKSTKWRLNSKSNLLLLTPGTNSTKFTQYFNLCFHCIKALTQTSSEYKIKPRYSSIQVFSGTITSHGTMKRICLEIISSKLTILHSMSSTREQPCCSHRVHGCFLYY